MVDNTLTFETSRALGLEEDNVTETVNVGAFPSGFTAGRTLMVVIDTTLENNLSDIIRTLERMKKKIFESTNLML